MKIYLTPIFWGILAMQAYADDLIEPDAVRLAGGLTATEVSAEDIARLFPSKPETVVADTSALVTAAIIDTGTSDTPEIIDVSNLAAVNSLIDRYHAREVVAGSMHDQLRALRHRVLANPFPIPPKVEHGSLFDMAIGMAAKYDIPRQLFFNLVTAESNWDPVITSHRGAIGLTQLMPGTAEELGVDPWDTYENLEGGARYLSQQYRTFGTWELALAAYNAGPGAVRKYNGIPPYTETQEYVEKIMKDFDNNEALQLENVLDIVLGEPTPAGG